MMKKIFLTSAFALISLPLLTACNEEEIKTVEFYQNNKEKRVEKLEECKKVGVKKDSGYTANCQNAAKADRISELNKPFIDPLE